MHNVAAALQSGNGVKEYAMNSDESTSQNIEWWRWIILAFGMALFLFGAWRFVLKHHFGFIDAIHCCLAVIPAGLLLLVIAYVVQHAKLASVVPLAAAVALLFSSPVFDVALGLVLMGAIAGPALSDWKNENRLRESTTTHDGENEELK